MKEYEVIFTTTVEARVTVEANSEEDAMSRVESSDVYDLVGDADELSYSNLEIEVKSAKKVY